MNAGLFNQQQGGNGNCSACQSPGSEPGGQTCGDNDQRRYFSGCLNFAPGSGDIRRDDQSSSCRQQDRGDKLDLVDPQPSRNSRKNTQERECSHARETCLRTGGMSRPLPFETDGKTAESGNQDTDELLLRDQAGIVAC